MRVCVCLWHVLHIHSIPFIHISLHVKTTYWHTPSNQKSVVATSKPQKPMVGIALGSSLPGLVPPVGSFAPAVPGFDHLVGRRCAKSLVVQTRKGRVWQFETVPSWSVMIQLSKDPKVEEWLKLSVEVRGVGYCLLWIVAICYRNWLLTMV